jgi:hypothetical protein
MMNTATEKYDKLYKNSLEPAFKKFDKDNSNSIDKDELRALSEQLGTVLNDEQVELALKDLDLNGDGVIDISEFARWYFTGMKSYNGTKRSMLRIKGHVKDILGKASEQAKLSLIGKELKINTNTVKVSFNNPENAGTKIDAAFYAFGPTCTEIQNELTVWLNGTCSSQGNESQGFAQLKIQCGNSEEVVAKLKDINTRIKASSMSDNKNRNPQFKAENGFVVIGHEFNEGMMGDGTTAKLIAEVAKEDWMIPLK